MAPEQTSSRLDLVGRAVAVFSLVVYAMGFLVLSVHHAALGIAQFSLLKARMVAAGILLLVFIALAVLASARSFGYLRFDPVVRAPAEEPAASYVVFIAIYDLLVSSVILGYMTSTLFKPVLPDWRTWTITGYIAVSAIGVLVIRRHFQKTPLRCVLLACLLFGMLSEALPVFADSDLFVRAVFLFGAGLWFAYLNSIQEKIRQLVSPQLELAFFTTLTVIALFAVMIYPRVNFAWGGGTPSPAVLQFTGKPPIGQAERMNVWYVDENEYGYYVLRHESDRKAIFLPRQTISAIYFGESPDQTQPQR